MSYPSGLARKLYTMTWPMLFGVLALMSFQLVDSFFISLLGTEPLATMGFTMPINQLIIGIQIGVGIASTALISRAIGAEQNDYAKRLSYLVLLIGCGLMTALILAILLLKQPALHMLGADPSLFPYTDSYWLPWLLSVWCHAFLYFGNSLCRANGDTRLPGLMMVATSLINLVLDPLFIFVFELGLPGAAYATIVSCLLGSAVIFSRLLKRNWIVFNLQGMNVMAGIRSISQISLPAMLSQLMPGIAALMATRIVALSGSAAIAAWALGSRLETFSIVIVLALTMSMPPMLGRMLGARQLDEAHALVRMATHFILLLQAVIAVFWLVVSSWLANSLTSDPETANYLRSYLIWVPISYSMLGVCILMVSVCNALGMPMRAVSISILRLFAFYLPAVATGYALAGMQGIYLGVLIGNSLAGLSGWLLYKKGLQHLERRQATL